MIIVNISPNKLIQIGYEGEDKVTILRFSYSEKWLENGEGIFTVRVLRNGENQAYNAQVIKDDRENLIIDMTVTDIELSKEGYGEMQLVYTGADFVKKSPVYKYYVSRSVDEAVDPPESDVYTQIIESLSDLRTNFNELTNTVNEINDDIGDLTELTTTHKSNIVESINEVNAKSFVSVDDELSDVSTNPVQNKVITARINGLDSDVGALRTSVQDKADTSTVTALSDTVSNLSDSAQQYMEYTNSAITNLRDSLRLKADAQNVTALSGIVTGLQTSKADKSYVDTQLATKADTQTVSDLADDVSDLQTGLASKVSDVQVNGMSIVTDGVAEIPIAQNSQTAPPGLVKIWWGGFNIDANGFLRMNTPTIGEIKQGTSSYMPITPSNIDTSTFYGLARVAGHNERNSTLPVGTYSDEAKTAIRTMLGLQDVYDDYSSALEAIGGGS